MPEQIDVARRLPSLNALRAFRYVATHGSVTRAAIALGVSQSSVSRHISALEGEIGQSLFNRSSGFVLSSAGKELFEGVDQAFAGLEATVQRVKLGESVLFVKVVPTFAVRWLLPNVPKMDGLSIAPRWKGIAVDEEDFSFGIRYGQGNWPDDCIVRLYREHLVPVCSPTTADRIGPVRSSSDFERIDLLHSEPRSGDWSTWARTWSGDRFNTERGIYLDTLDHALRAAEDGLGVAMGDTLLVRESLQSGRLVPLIDESCASGESYFLARAPHLKDDSRVRRFQRWVFTALREAGA